MSRQVLESCIAQTQLRNAYLGERQKWLFFAGFRDFVVDAEIAHNSAWIKSACEYLNRTGQR